MLVDTLALALEQRSFSALQRAENSSIWDVVVADRVITLVSVLFSEPKIPQFPLYSTPPTRARRFQCSSASRKFLNRTRRSGASINSHVSVLFSEPKIPQYPRRALVAARVGRVSVLFSEPKIPQFKALNIEDFLPSAVSVLFSEPKIPQFLTASAQSP